MSIISRVVRSRKLGSDIPIVNAFDFVRLYGGNIDYEITDVPEDQVDKYAGPDYLDFYFTHNGIQTTQEHIKSKKLFSIDNNKQIVYEADIGLSTEPSSGPGTHFVLYFGLRDPNDYYNFYQFAVIEGQQDDNGIIHYVLNGTDINELGITRSDIRIKAIVEIRNNYQKIKVYANNKLIGSSESETFVTGYYQSYIKTDLNTTGTWLEEYIYKYRVYSTDLLGR
jgi:hypothetical protein